jgi:hypothetical protein
VAAQSSRERCVLTVDRKVPMEMAPIRDGLDRPSQARPPSLARHPRTTPTISRPVERKPGEVDGGRTFPEDRARTTPAPGRAAGGITETGLRQSAAASAAGFKSSSGPKEFRAKALTGFRELSSPWRSSP